MTQRFDAPQFLRVGRGLRIILCAILPALASGCASTSIEDALPGASASSTGATQQGTASASSQAAGAAVAAADAGPRDTGSFPNLNIIPQVANDQITDDEKTAQTTNLRATQQGAATTAAGLGKGMADPALLRKLAAQHAADALKKIDAQN